MSEKAHTSRVRHYIVLTVIVLTIVAAVVLRRDVLGRKRRRDTNDRQRGTNDETAFSSPPLAVVTHDTETVTLTVLAVLYNEFSVYFLSGAWLT